MRWMKDSNYFLRDRDETAQTELYTEPRTSPPEKIQKSSRIKRALEKQGNLTVPGEIRMTD